MVLCKDCKWFDKPLKRDPGCLNPQAGAKPDYIWGGYKPVPECPSNARGDCSHYGRKPVVDPAPPPIHGQPHPFSRPPKPHPTRIAR